MNGAWGTGKSEFVKRTSNRMKLIKFINLNYWKEKDDSSVIKNTYSKIHPFLHYFFIVLAVLSVAITVLLSPVVNLGLGSFLDNPISKVLAISALIVSVWQVFKYKLDSFYFVTLNFMFNIFNNKVIVIDDFDRIGESKQEEVYKIINILKGKVPIIILGEFENISKSDGDFLKKIIDERIELPLALSFQNIWEQYFKQLGEYFSNQEFSGLKYLCIKEERNLRDQFQFNELINYEIIEKEKWDNVQISQYLVIIYVSWFHPEIYKTLLKGEMPTLSEGFRAHEEKREQYGNNSLKSNLSYCETTNDIVVKLLEDNDNYPLSFKRKKDSYFLSESISNLNVEDAKKLLTEDTNLVRIIHTPKNIDNDFLSYLKTNFKNFDNEIKEKLVNISLNEIKIINENEFISSIIHEKSKEIMPFAVSYFSNGQLYKEFPQEWGDLREEETDEIRRKEWEKILEENGFDSSQKIYFYHHYLLFSYKDIGQFVNKIDIGTEQIDKLKRQDFYILIYLSQNELLDKPKEWSNLLWDKINELSNEQYLSILLANGILRKKDQQIYYKNSKDVTYQVIEKEEHPFNGQIDNSKTIKNHMKQKLETLQNEGYTLEFIKKEKDN